jgi:hypothetical protein
MAPKKVGGEVDALCSKCRMTLAHTILAMVGSKIARVRCNTCNGDHVYRTEGGTALSRGSTTPRAPRPEKVVVTFDQRLAGKDLASAPKYSPKETYALDQIINHPSFGVGIVTEVRGDKVEVAFKADSKTLVHGRGGEPAAKPMFHPPAPRSESPADKQPAPDAIAPPTLR